MKSKRMTKFRSTLRLVFVNFFNHNVGKNAAALAYYLLFALFPMLIFITNLLGLLDLNVYSIIESLNDILPKDVVSIVHTYLDYISNTSSHTLMWFAFVLSIWFPLRAVQGLMDDVRRAYGLGLPEKPAAYLGKQLLYTVVFLVVMVLTLFLSVTGENVLSFVGSLFPEDSFPISDYLLKLWQYLRFLLAALLMLTAIGALYSLASERKPSVKSIMPGILFALVSWLVVSIGFSFYVENFAQYSFIYGALGTVIVLLVWLNLTAVILILGAEINAAIYKANSQSEQTEKQK